MQPVSHVEPARTQPEPLPAVGETIDLRQAERQPATPRPAATPRPVAPPPAQPPLSPRPTTGSHRRHTARGWGWWPLLILIGITSSMGNLSIILPDIAVPLLLVVLAWLAYQSNARRGNLRHARHVAQVLMSIAVVVLMISWGVGFWPFFIFFWMMPFGRRSCRP